MKNTWAYTFPAEIIVCDDEGIILEMNETAIRQYRKEGGAAMIGSNVFDHHPEPARKQAQEMSTNQKYTQYTTEKNGLKRLVCIAPWYQNKQYAGFTLLTLDLSDNMANIVKD